ncbi:MAG: AfsR/SARP family transcriptional regulator [Pseudonocardia sp.]
MYLNLMGPLEVTEGGSTLTPTAAKPRQVLALLAASAGSMVSTEQLIDELWPEGPPRSAKTTMQTYVYHLRQVLSRSKEAARGRKILATCPAGYILTVPRENVDVFRFLQIMADGREALRRGDAFQASDLFRSALSLWRGSMLADVSAGPRLQGHVAFFEEQRIEALSLRIEIDLETGRHHEVIAELRSLTKTHHLHEWVHIRLMQALHRSGRRGEALDTYQKLRRLLGDELGLEPSVEAIQLQQEILVS